MFMVVKPEARDCEICHSASPLFGVVDFHKNCIEAQGKILELSGRPIYYRQCVSCGFVFTDEFDDWSTEAFSHTSTTTTTSPSIPVTLRPGQQAMPKPSPTRFAQ
jgi:hypothetical protein